MSFTSRYYTEVSLHLQYGQSSCAAGNRWGVCADHVVYICTFLYYMKDVLTFRRVHTVSKHDYYFYIVRSQGTHRLQIYVFSIRLLLDDFWIFLRESLRIIKLLQNTVYIICRRMYIYDKISIHSS